MTKGLLSHERGQKDLPLQSRNLHENLSEKWPQCYSLRLTIPAHVASSPCLHRKGSQSNRTGLLLQPSGEKVLLDNFCSEDDEIQENYLIALKPAILYQLVWSLMGIFTRKLEVKRVINFK